MDRTENRAIHDALAAYVEAWRAEDMNQAWVACRGCF
jgi:hypothetical protein